MVQASIPARSGHCSILGALKLHTSWAPHTLNEFSFPLKCWWLEKFQQAADDVPLESNMWALQGWGRWKSLLPFPYFSRELRAGSDRGLAALIRQNPMQWLLVRQIKTQGWSKLPGILDLCLQTHTGIPSNHCPSETIAKQRLQVWFCVQQTGMSAAAKWLGSTQSGIWKLETIVHAYK